MRVAEEARALVRAERVVDDLSSGCRRNNNSAAAAATLSARITSCWRLLYFQMKPKMDDSINCPPIPLAPAARAPDCRQSAGVRQTRRRPRRSRTSARCRLRSSRRVVMAAARPYRRLPRLSGVARPWASIAPSTSAAWSSLSLLGGGRRGAALGRPGTRCSMPSRLRSTAGSRAADSTPATTPSTATSRPGAAPRRRSSTTAR